MTKDKKLRVAVAGILVPAALLVGACGGSNSNEDQGEQMGQEAQKQGEQMGQEAQKQGEKEGEKWEKKGEEIGKKYEDEYGD